MVPALVNQLVTLLKDSSLGALVLLPAVDDLLHQGKIVGDFRKSPLQGLLVTAAIYIVVNSAVSAVARRLEQRQARRYGRTEHAVGPLAEGGVGLGAPGAIEN
jgi:glutamate transport system permease protein